MSAARTSRSARPGWRRRSRRPPRGRQRSRRPSSHPWPRWTAPTVAPQRRRPRRSENADGSVDALAHMDEPVRRLALALVGAVALTAERADELADSLAERGGMSKEEVRARIDEASTRWRGDAVRMGERAGATLQGALRELGLVTRDEWDELELRVAQLEHRLRLLESRSPQPTTR